MHLTCMADWKQITARIRRARTGKDPATQLSNLYQKTRDAMVAFELARFFETAGQNANAAQWYSTAAERFRRADWKAKAQQAAVRLGGQPDGPPVALSEDSQLTSPVVTAPEPGIPFAQTASTFEAIVAPAEEADEAQPSLSPSTPNTRTGPARPRGRRGGRNRRRTGTALKGAVLPARETPSLSTEPPPPVDEA